MLSPPRSNELAGGGFRGWGGEVGNQEFHDGVWVIGATFEAVVRGLQELQALQETSFGNFAGGLQGELGLLGTHGQGAGGLVAVRDAFQLAGFN